MARGKQPAFWLAVAGVSYLTPIVVKLAADRAGQSDSGIGKALKTLDNYAKAANG